MNASVNLQPVLPEVIRATVGLPNLTIVDVGCSGGITPEWGNLDFVEAVGFDPLVAEIERLKQSAPSNHHYHAAYVTGPDGQPNRTDSWFHRASHWRAHETLNRDYVRDNFNAGEPVVYNKNCLTLDDFFEDRPVHFIKTDTDGFDIQALRGAEKVLKNVVGVHCEANFHAFQANSSVWRDIDTYLVDLGLSLADIQPFRYTRSALPGEFTNEDYSNTRQGAIVWADCLYLRDPQDLQGDSLITLAVAAELYGLPDVSAEALIRLGDELGVEKTKPALDALVRYSPFPDIGSYEMLMKKFEQDVHSFGPARTPNQSWRSRITRLLRGRS